MQSLASARRLCFDSNALIYYLNSVEPYAAAIRTLLDDIRVGRREGMLSVVTEIELLVRPLRDGTLQDVERVRALMDAQGFNVVPLDREIARAAAGVRAESGLRLPDAAVVATAMVTGCDVIVGNDARCAKRVKEIPYLLLDDLVEKE
ncbi:MAG: PIN domain-containing protein [Chloroflexi bacterium]|nr:PIN domain-containing protein [Chloroflexota bacterium]